MVRFHGNYCGPNWSAGRVQTSVISHVPSIDRLDHSCRSHDANYFLGADPNAIDRQFISENLFQGGKSTLAALAVGANYLARGNIVPMSSTPRLRNSAGSGSTGGTCSAPTPKSRSAPRASPVMQPRKKKLKYKPTMTLAATGPPTSLASVITPGQVSVNRTNDGVTVNADFLMLKTAVPGTSSTTLVSFVYLSPYLLGNPSIATIAQTYEDFRFNSFDLYYRGFQPTSTGGSFQIIVEEDPNTLLPSTSTSAFYNRAFTGGNTLITPIWQPANLRCTVSKEWKSCDTYMTDDLKECTSGIVWMAQDGTSNVAGYVLARASISFRRFRYNPRSLIAGSFLGPAVAQTVTAKANPVQNALVELTGSGFTVGDIYRVVFLPQSTGWTAPTGLTTATMFAPNKGPSFTLTSGSVVFAFASATNNLQCYPLS